jgi:hypothetical protein
MDLNSLPSPIKKEKVKINSRASGSTLSIFQWLQLRGQGSLPNGALTPHPYQT